MAPRVRRPPIVVVAAAVLFASAVVAGLVWGGSAISQSSSAAADATQVEFIVTGSAPNGVDIRYGSDETNYQGSLPLDVTKSFKGNALYWVMAQLRGSGRITCKVMIGSAVRTGHAVGGYDTCTAQSPSDLLGGWR